MPAPKSKCATSSRSWWIKSRRVGLKGAQQIRGSEESRSLGVTGPPSPSWPWAGDEALLRADVPACMTAENVDGRDKPGHDERVGELAPQVAGTRASANRKLGQRQIARRRHGPGRGR